MGNTAEALVIGKEERFLFDDWTSQGATELILVKSRLFSGSRAEEASGVEVCIAQKFPYFTMELIRAAFDASVNYGAAGAAVVGAVVVGLLPELGECIRVHLNYLVRETLVTGAVSIVIDAIEHKII